MTTRILLIEDDEEKRESVLAAINTHIQIPQIVVTRSVRRAIDTLSDVTANFELIVADMSLPTFDIEMRERGGSPRPFGGIEVFEYLDRNDSTLPVLVVTSYPILSDGKKSMSVSDLTQQLTRDFPRNFHGLVYFDTQFSDWERDIGAHLAKFNRK